MDARDSLRAAARASAPDWYATAVLAPADVADDLMAVAALVGEIGRIPTLVAEPTVGLIRLQWWRDALAAAAATGEKSGNPILDSFADVARRRAIPGTLPAALVDGHARALEADGVADEAAFAAYLDAAHGTPFRLATASLGESQGETEPLAAAAGAAMGRVATALTLPLHLAHGRAPLPPERLDLTALAEVGEDAARAAVSTAVSGLADETRVLAAPLRAAKMGRKLNAFLPVALIEPYLRALQDRRRDPLRELADISPLSRLARLWWAARRGSL